MRVIITMKRGLSVVSQNAFHTFFPGKIFLLTILFFQVYVYGITINNDEQHNSTDEYNVHEGTSSERIVLCDDTKSIFHSDVLPVSRQGSCVIEEGEKSEEKSEEGKAFFGNLNQKERDDSASEKEGEDEKKEGGAKKSEKAPLETVTKTPVETIKFYCQCWINNDFKTMYKMLDEALIENMRLLAFKERFDKDATVTQGLSGAKILDEGKDEGTVTVCRVSLYFRNQRVPVREITARLCKTAKGYRILESGLIPVDLDGL